jgi:outer membrane protein TolC
MRIALGLCALAAFGSVASSQQPAATGPSPALATVAVRTPSPGSQGADSLRLTRQQAITEALTNNPLIVVAREQTSESRARRVEATALPDPVFDAEWDYQQHVLSGSQSNPISLGLTIPDPLKLQRAGDVATADIHSNEQNLRLQQQTIAVQTSQAYDALLAAFQHQKDLTDALTAARDFLTKTQAQYTAGVVRKLDVDQAQVAAVQAQVALAANGRTTATAQAALNHLLGRQKTAPIMPVDTLEIPAALPDSATIEATALANRPEVAGAVDNQIGAQANTALVKSFWLPDFNVSVGRDYVAYGPGPPLLSTAVTFPIPFYYRAHAKGDIAEAQHHELELAATTRDTRATVVQDVRTAWATAANAIDLAIAIRDQLLPAAREEYRVSLAAYQAGGTSAFEVIQAQQDLISAESQLTDDLAAALSARADLERALGNSTDRLGAIAP